MFRKYDKWCNGLSSDTVQVETCCVPGHSWSLQKSKRTRSAIVCS